MAKGGSLNSNETISSLGTPRGKKGHGKQNYG